MPGCIQVICGSMVGKECRLLASTETPAHVWNTVVMSGLVPLVATWNC